MMGHLDDEIRAVEQRIARERDGLIELAGECGETARDSIVSPPALLAVAAFGFVLGEALHRARPVAPARKLGLAGAIAGAAFSLVRARYGSPWALAQQAWSRTMADRAQRDSPRAADQPGGPDRAANGVRAPQR
jgi:hypothetical protein